MELSVVIPVLNEQARIEACLDLVSQVRGVHEIIVVDGGSDDDTVAIARAHGVASVVRGPRGRGAQMNVGAGRASGDTLLFLHADVVLPTRVGRVVDEILSRPGVAAGAFRTWHVAHAWKGSWKRRLLHLADIRSRYSKLPYGDQALFVRAALFHRVGGFPEIALMEDLSMVQRLRGKGRIVVASDSVRVSGRRFESASLQQTLLVNVFPFLYALGVSPAVLARLYGNPR